MAKPVSQSRTMWVKKGTVVGGKAVKKGYVAQYGKPEKRVTAKIKLEEATRRGKVGDVAEYKRGRYKRTVGKGRVDRSKTTAGGGVTKAQAAAARRKVSTKQDSSKVTSGGLKFSPQTIKKMGAEGPKVAPKAARVRPTRGPANQTKTTLAGSGSDRVNAATSAGSAKTSSVHDSFIAEPGVRSRSPLGRGRPKQVTSNRPVIGQMSRLQKTKSGQLRWVKVVK